MDSGNIVAVALATGMWVTLSPICDVTCMGGTDTNTDYIDGGHFKPAQHAGCAISISRFV